MPGYHQKKEEQRVLERGNESIYFFHPASFAHTSQQGVKALLD
jgi:hypothetical protein